MDVSAAMAMRTAASATTPPSSTSTFNSTSSSKTIPFRLQPRKHHLPLMKSLKCIQSSSSHSNPFQPNTPTSASPLSCSAQTFLSSNNSSLVTAKLQCLVDEFQSLPEPLDRVKRLLHYATLLPPFDDSARIDLNRVMGCTARVWIEVKIDGEGKVRFAADSDSEITKGFCTCLVWLLDGSLPEEVLKLGTDDLADINVGLPGNERSRVNTWHNVLISMQKRTKKLIAEREGKALFEHFPSLVVTTDKSSS